MGATAGVHATEKMHVLRGDGAELVDKVKETSMPGFPMIRTLNLGEIDAKLPLWFACFASPGTNCGAKLALLP